MSKFDEGFVDRLTSSFDRVLYGLDLLISIILSISVYILFFRGTPISTQQALVDGGLQLTTTLIIVIVTGVSILVSLSNSEAVKTLSSSQLYGKFLFTFEFTAISALITSVYGIFIKVIWLSDIGFIVYLFLFIYTVLSVATIISRFITYANKIAELSLASDLPDPDEVTVEEVHEESDDQE